MLAYHDIRGGGCYSAHYSCQRQRNVPPQRTDNLNQPLLCCFDTLGGASRNCSSATRRLETGLVLLTHRSFATETAVYSCQHHGADKMLVMLIPPPVRDPLEWSCPCSQSYAARPCYAHHPCPTPGSRPCVISFRRTKVGVNDCRATMMTVCKVWRRQVHFLVVWVMTPEHIPPSLLPQTLFPFNLQRLGRYLVLFLWLSGAVHSFSHLFKPVAFFTFCRPQFTI